MSTAKSWQPDSWRKLPIKQQPSYESESALNAVLADIKKMPPLIFVGEVERLKAQLAKAMTGESFVLQGGDCAERFQDCNREAITQKLKIMLQMSVVLCYGLRKPIIRVGRIAGQYAKPRSADLETVDGKEIPVYRGDIINSFEANAEARKPDPNRIRQAYFHSIATLNYIRALTKGGFADLHHPQSWDLKFVSNAPKKIEYERIVHNIQDAIVFMESLGTHEEKLATVEFYTSHEGLLLPLEEAMTQYVPEYDAYYNLGAHTLWIGDRTRQLDGAHIEYFRGIANPLGLKVGPSSDPRDIIAICKALNPRGEAGKVTLISRYGNGKAGKHLPQLIEAMKGTPVVWSIDPMHGNAIKTDAGTKTRNFDDILGEVTESLNIHKTAGSKLGGIHFELTGDDVTECIGGSAGITADELSHNYETYCDPRLNYSQSLEMAFLVSQLMAPGKG
ncbi:MAG: 3-deoxy-7-phosphoheptulonate synthase [Proteobacteria bacterium]|nr:MAG: 3-deoxy-7-phosphoheptulonate synthase [Pseudomonadota bacterium]